MINRKQQFYGCFANRNDGQQLDAKLRTYLAKVGVEGSNPFARSIYAIGLEQYRFTCPSLGTRLSPRAIRSEKTPIRE